MDLPTYDQLRQIARDELLQKNSKITAEAVDLPGTDAFALVAAAAAVGDEVVGTLARQQAALLLGSARGKDLDRLVYDRYKLLRKAAAPAIGSVTFSLPIAAVSDFSIPARTLLQTSDGIQFVTINEGLFITGSTTLSVPVRATVAGLQTQARPATITNLIGAVPLAPAGLTVSNPLATAGAANAELDDSLSSRALNFFETARRGTLGAIQQGALAVPGVATATTFENLDALGRPARSVQLLVTDAFTEQLAQGSSVPPAYATQSAVFTQAVFDGLIESRAAGINVEVHLAKVVLQTVILGLAFRAGYDVDQTALQARAAIVGYVNSLAPGASFVVSGAVTALRSVPGLLVSGNEVLSPAGGVVPTPLEVLRTAMSYVSISSLASLSV
jgi:hypothetical protein